MERRAMKIAFVKRSPGWWLGVGCLLAAALLMGCEDPPATGPSVDQLTQQRQANNKANGGGHGGGGAPQAKKGPGKGPNEGPGPKGGGAFAQVDENYRYESLGKRDPFRSFRFETDVADGGKGGPLADFELGQLRVAAVIWDSVNPRALIRDPGGRSYIIQEGSPIGKNNGRVIHIGDNLLVVKETYVDFAGNRTTKDVELRIRTSQGG